MRRLAALALMALWLAACAAPAATVSPAPSRDLTSPYGTTQEEFLLQARACVEARGYSMTLDLAEAKFSFVGGSDADFRAASAALHDCVASIDPARLRPPPALTAEQLEAWYIYRLKQAKCLESAGYAVPEAPPQQVFEDTAGEWDPFDALLHTGVTPAQSDVSHCQHLAGQPEFLDW